jgi:hypothetical protein
VEYLFPDFPVFRVLKKIIENVHKKFHENSPVSFSYREAVTQKESTRTPGGHKLAQVARAAVVAAPPILIWGPGGVR